MPLREGKSKSVVSKNIEEMIRSYKQSGMIGDTKPRNMKHALRIASRIAHDKIRQAARRDAIKSM